jgi:hypothetical protein
LSRATRFERFVVLIGRHEAGPATTIRVMTVCVVVVAVRLGLAADRARAHHPSCL